MSAYTYAIIAKTTLQKEGSTTIYLSTITDILKLLEEAREAQWNIGKIKVLLNGIQNVKFALTKKYIKHKLTVDFEGNYE